MIKDYLSKPVIAIILLVATANVSAINCNDPSPNLAIEGDRYYDINEVEPLSPQQKQILQNMFSSFAGKRLEGYGSFTECTGPESNSKKVTKKESISAEINQTSDGNLVFSIDSLSADRNTTYHETVSYFDSQNQYRINTLTDNVLNISYKLRVKKILTEEITEISVNGRNIIITVTRYLGGYFAMQQVRKLSF